MCAPLRQSWCFSLFCYESGYSRPSCAILAFGQARLWQKCGQRLLHLFLAAESGGRATARGLEMQMQDALDFRDGLRQVERTVRAGDDEFGLRAIEVRALIKDNAIGAIGRIALAAVASDWCGAEPESIAYRARARASISGRAHARWAGKRNLSYPR